MPYKDPEEGKRHKKEYRQRTKKHIAEHAKEYRIKNIEKVRAYRKKYYQEHRNKIMQRASDWVKNNKDKVVKRQIEYDKKRLIIDIYFKLKHRIRGRIKRAIDRNSRRSSAVKDLGCSIDFFKTYIESKFLPVMSWDNWGKVWQLDHIIPLASFDLTDPIQFKQAVYYTNMQPLTIEAHRKKTNLETKERARLKRGFK